MTNPGPTKEEYDSLIFKLATLESELGKARMLLEAPAKPTWRRRFWRLGVKAAVVAAMVVCLVGGVIYADKGYTIHSGVTTGKDYLKLGQAGKAFQAVYAAGLIEGIYLAPFFGAPEKNVEWVYSCTKGMDSEQIAAILEKYLRDQPGTWHLQMNVPAYQALRGVCPQSWEQKK